MFLPIFQSKFNWTSLTPPKMINVTTFNVKSCLTIIAYLQHISKRKKRTKISKWSYSLLV